MSIDTNTDTSTANPVDYSEFGLAVAQDLRQLLALHDREVDQALISALHEVEFPHNLGLNLESAKAVEMKHYMFDVLNEMPKTLDPKFLDELAVDYASIYLHNGIHASPYESVWVDEDNLTQQEAMFEIRKWYAKYGVESENWRMRSDDHLVLQLQFIALLLDPESVFPSEVSVEIMMEKRLEAATHFLDQHLLLWLADFSTRVVQRCDTDFYASLATLTDVYIEQLRDSLEAITQIARPTPEDLEAQLQEKLKLIEEPIAFMPGMASSW